MEGGGREVGREREEWSGVLAVSLPGLHLHFQRIILLATTQLPQALPMSLVRGPETNRGCD
eukprot:scaffold45585_cov23-Prasinocladus_malaysianus.AAC.1